MPVVQAAWDGVGVAPHVDVAPEAALEADRLIARIEGRARRYSLTRREDGSSFAAADRVVIRFLRTDAGDVIGLDWTEGGRSSPARRMA